ncbi:MAG: divergent PAP2 family protein [Patescibacteria group bacterium]|jgi:hypothetical protein
MYQLIIIPIVVGAITQIIKLIIDGIPNNLNWQHIYNDYGGMPSSHTAFVVSLVTAVGFREGLDSAAFAIALILMLIVVRDAIGFRREIGRNATMTNLLAKEVFKSKKVLVPHLRERIGHSIPEVIAGALLGFSLTSILYLVFFFQ